MMRALWCLIFAYGTVSLIRDAWNIGCALLDRWADRGIAKEIARQEEARDALARVARYYEIHRDDPA